MSVTHATASCEIYKFDVATFSPIPFLDNFVKGVISSTKSEDWSLFIEEFGTHVIHEVILGGRATQEISYTSESESKMKSLGIDIGVAAKAKYAKFVGDASFNLSQHEEEVNYS